MMTALLLAAALQAAAPAPPVADRRAADLVTGWTLCLDGSADADAARGLASAEAASAAIERALAACAREEAAIHAELVRRRGAAEAGPVVAGFRNRAREMLGRRLESSIGPAADPAMAAGRAFAACTGTHIAAGALGSADAPAAIVDAALARCAAHEPRIRAALLARGTPAADADAFVEALRTTTRTSGPALVAQVRARAAARR